MDAFTAGYITCALWIESHSPSGEGNDCIPFEDLDAELSAEATQRMETDCRSFQDTHLALLKQAYALMDDSGKPYTEARAGHDFWLTRNGHGTGYWDRGLGDVGEHLASAARTFGESSLYLGDDNEIHIA